MKVKEASAIDLYAIAMNMRVADFEEFTALHDTDSRELLAERLARRYHAHPGGIVAFALDGAPIAAGATVLARPNVATLMFFATERLNEIGLPLTRFIRNTLFPALRAEGVHRIEAVSSAAHEEAHRWIRALGLEKEAECPGYGKAGQLFYQFAWVSDDHRAPRPCQ